MTQSVLPDGFSAYFDAWEAKIGSFLSFTREAAALQKAAAVQNSAGVVAGLPFAVKDNIAVQGMKLSCGSRLLADFVSSYDATAVRKLKDAGAFVLGKTNLDEFGMGSSTDNSALAQTNNPWDTSRVPGGSSGGSAAAVAAGLVPFALGSDTGGSVRQPASFCGVYGLKPGYGAVSRYGLVAYASSLESIGILADSAERTRDVFRIIRGSDPLDQTTLVYPEDKLTSMKKTGRIAVLRTDSMTGTAEKAAVMEDAVEQSFNKTKEGFRKLGYSLHEVEIKSLEYAVPAYYTIASAEASANLARFDGIRYGRRPDWAENPDELIDKARHDGFGSEVKLRILLGTFVLRSGFQDRYYLRAQRIRSAIREEFEQILGKADDKDGFDAVLMPVFPTRAFGRGSDALSPFAQKTADIYTCCANLASLPALAFPVSVEGGLPVGMQLLGRSFSEEVLMDMASEFAALCPPSHPAEYRSFWS